MRPLLVELLAGHMPSGLTRLLPTGAMMYAIAVAALVLLFIRRAGPVVTQAAAIRCALGAFVSGMVGARAFYLLFASASGADVGLAGWVSTTGTASWGAYIGAVGGILLLRDRVVPPLAYLDAAASCAPLGIVLGRIGCFLNGDDFGRITDVAWAVRYPPGSFAYQAHLADGLISNQAGLSLPTHPLQLYLGALALLTFVVVSAVYRRRDLPAGTTLAAFLLLDGCGRFFLEFLRAPAAGGSDAGLSLSQVMALTTLGLGGLVYANTKRSMVTLSDAV